MDVAGLVQNELKSNPLNAVSFIRCRNFGITEVELEQLLTILTYDEGLVHQGFMSNELKKAIDAHRLQLRQLLASFPEVYPVINKVVSQMNFSSSELLVCELFPKISQLLAYTTDTSAVENVIKHVKNDIGLFLDEQNPAKVESFLNFLEELMKHIEVEGFLEQLKSDKKSRKKLKWLDGYEFSELMYNFYDKIPLINLPQALRLLDMYYERIVRPVILKNRKIKQEKGGQEFHNLKYEKPADAEYEFVDEDNMQDMFNKINGEMPILEHLDFVFVEYSKKMNFYEASHVLYIFAKCGYTQSMFLSKFCELYIDLLQLDPYLEQSVLKPSSLLKLVFALGKSKNYKNEKLVWRVLELQMLKNDVFKQFNLEELRSLLAIWSIKKYGSQEFWTQGIFTYLEHIEKLEYQYSKTGEELRQLELDLNRVKIITNALEGSDEVSQNKNDEKNGGDEYPKDNNKDLDTFKDFQNSNESSSGNKVYEDVEIGDKGSKVIRDKI